MFAHAYPHGRMPQVLHSDRWAWTQSHTCWFFFRGNRQQDSEYYVAGGQLIQESVPSQTNNDGTSFVAQDDTRKSFPLVGGSTRSKAKSHSLGEMQGSPIVSVPFAALRIMAQILVLNNNVGNKKSAYSLGFKGSGALFRLRHTFLLMIYHICK